MRLKAEIGRPSVEVVPADPGELGAAAAILERFGERTQSSPKGTAVRLRGAEDLPDVVRALDAEGVALAHLELVEPTLNDVFLAKTGRSLEGAGAAEADPEPEPDPVAA